MSGEKVPGSGLGDLGSGYCPGPSLNESPPLHASVFSSAKWTPLSLQHSYQFSSQRNI